jgi:thymidylate synthase
MNSLNLYKPDEYPVRVGNPESTNVLCVVWQELDRVIQHHPNILNEYAIIGNLRSSFGINVMFYNLARNPHIQNIYVWAPDALSNTDIGKSGKEALIKLWASGEYDFVEEVDRKAVGVMIKRITLINWKEKNPPKRGLFHSTVLDTLKYVNPIFFPEFKIKTPETFPSEKYTYPIRVHTGAEGFGKLLHTIWKYGDLSKIDIEGQKVKEIRGAIVVVENEKKEIVVPDWLEKHNSFCVTKESLNQYYRTQFSDKPYKKKLYSNIYRFERPRDYSYLYAELLFAFPRPFELERYIDKVEKEKTYTETKRIYLNNYSSNIKRDKKWIQRMEHNISGKEKRFKILREYFLPRINQINYVINRIKGFPDDLDKEVNLWDVRKNIHLTSGRPCLNKLSFSVRNKKIDLHAFFRSHDICKAWFYNYYGIRLLQQYVAIKTGYTCGYTIIESESAHIYERDFKRVEEFVMDQFTKMDPIMFFNPKTDSDHRGSLLVKVIGREIVVILQDSLTGNNLMKLRGKTARELIYILRHHDLISRTDHALFIGSELAKAEMCMKKGIVYKYDSVINV